MDGAEDPNFSIGDRSGDGDNSEEDSEIHARADASSQVTLEPASGAAGRASLAGGDTVSSTEDAGTGESGDSIIDRADADARARTPIHIDLEPDEVATDAAQSQLQANSLDTLTPDSQTRRPYDNEDAAIEITGGSHHVKVNIDDDPAAPAENAACGCSGSALRNLLPDGRFESARAKLDPETWLNDDVMLAVIWIVQRQDTWIVDSLCLDVTKPKAFLNEYKGQPSILIPLHHKNPGHWTLGHIDVAKQQINHYASL